ncbi:MAG: hypothetical protein JRJ45_08300 [Deltaproteobacteria bacterium]|nr:hypothetical protein [Deltaproteobacteria bacterium]
MSAIKYWLLRHDYIPDVGNGWYSMRIRFFDYAAKRLRSKVSHCLAMITTIGKPYTEWEDDIPILKGPNYTNVTFLE